jgi:hypothetical protein
MLEELLLTMRASSHTVCAYENTATNDTRRGTDERPMADEGERPPREWKDLHRMRMRIHAANPRKRNMPQMPSRSKGEGRSAMNKCPKCGHTWLDAKRASGGKARWRGMSKAQRKQAASAAAKARWAKSANAAGELQPPLNNQK